jgi:hypothetical protein
MKPPPLCTATVRLPLVTRSEANRREHWAAVRRRTTEHRRVAGLALRGHAWALLSALSPLERGRVRIVVELTRVAPGQLDSDNLVGSQKGVRDGIADAFGIDDGDARFEWHYRQRKGRPREYGVEVAIALIDTALEDDEGHGDGVTTGTGRRAARTAPSPARRTSLAGRTSEGRLESTEQIVGQRGVKSPARRTRNLATSRVDRGDAPRVGAAEGGGRQSPGAEGPKPS